MRWLVFTCLVYIGCTCYPEVSKYPCSSDMQWVARTSSIGIEDVCTGYNAIPTSTSGVYDICCPR